MFYEISKSPPIKYTLENGRATVKHSELSDVLEGISQLNALREHSEITQLVISCAETAPDNKALVELIMRCRNLADVAIGGKFVDKPYDIIKVLLNKKALQIANIAHQSFDVRLAPRLTPRNPELVLILDTEDKALEAKCYTQILIKEAYDDSFHTEEDANRVVRVFLELKEQVKDIKFTVSEEAQRFETGQKQPVKHKTGGTLHSTFKHLEDSLRNSPHTFRRHTMRLRSSTLAKQLGSPKTAIDTPKATIDTSKATIATIGTPKTAKRRKATIGTPKTAKRRRARENDERPGTKRGRQETHNEPINQETLNELICQERSERGATVVSHDAELNLARLFSTDSEHTYESSKPEKNYHVWETIKKHNLEFEDDLPISSSEKANQSNNEEAAKPIERKCPLSILLVALSSLPHLTKFELATAPSIEIDCQTWSKFMLYFKDALSVRSLRIGCLESSQIDNLIKYFTHFPKHQLENINILRGHFTPEQQLRLEMGLKARQVLLKKKEIEKSSQIPLKMKEKQDAIERLKDMLIPYMCDKDKVINRLQAGKKLESKLKQQLKARGTHGKDVLKKMDSFQELIDDLKNLQKSYGTQKETLLENGELLSEALEAYQTAANALIQKLKACELKESELSEMEKACKTLEVAFIEQLEACNKTEAQELQKELNNLSKPVTLNFFDNQSQKEATIRK